MDNIVPKSWAVRQCAISAWLCVLVWCCTNSEWHGEVHVDDALCVVAWHERHMLDGRPMPTEADNGM